MTNAAARVVQAPVGPVRVLRNALLNYPLESDLKDSWRILDPFAKGYRAEGPGSE